MITQKPACVGPAFPLSCNCLLIYRIEFLYRTLSLRHRDHPIKVKLS